MLETVETGLLPKAIGKSLRRLRRRKEPGVECDKLTFLWLRHVASLF